jgi:hypothetical protein
VVGRLYWYCRRMRCFCRERNRDRKGGCGYCTGIGVDARVLAECMGVMRGYSDASEGIDGVEAQTTAAAAAAFRVRLARKARLYWSDS